MPKKPNRRRTPLGRWLDDHGLRADWFAARVSRRLPRGHHLSPALLSRIRWGRQTCSLAVAEAISAETGGEVGMADLPVSRANLRRLGAADGDPRKETA